MQNFQKFIVFVVTFLVSLTSFAEILYPRASEQVYGVFLQGNRYEIPSRFWDNYGSSKNQILRAYAHNSHDPIFMEDNFWNAFGGKGLENGRIRNYIIPHTASKYAQYPSIYEGITKDFKDYPTSSDPGRQCTAFVKLATRNSSGTGTWFADENVMSRANYDGSATNKYRGRSVAYWTNTTYSYRNHPGGSHTGIFLGYDKLNGTEPGFWIADENWDGDPSGKNPSGEIRKHFISSYGSGRSDAKRYYFVKIDASK